MAKIHSITIITLLFAIIYTTMAEEWENPQIFFNKTAENITWAHAVNSQQNLKESLSNDAIMMLEADVSLIGDDITPMMAHSSTDKSDLSLEEFIQKTISNNNNNKNKKGIKLDFKTFEVFNASVQILQKYEINMTFPIFLNADILKGHVNATKTPVDADKFLTATKKILPKSILSIGWTTPDTSLKGNNDSYTKQNIDDMLEKIKMITSTQPITYPVRANLAVNSISILSELIEKSSKNNPTLTIWSTKDDTYNKTLLNELIKKIGSDKVYVDLPAETPSPSPSSAIRFGANVIGITLTLLLIINGIF